MNPEMNFKTYLSKALAEEKIGAFREAAESLRNFLQYAPAQHEDISYAKELLAELGD